MALNQNHLVTLSQARTWLGIPVASVQLDIDSVIETCINAASGMIETFLDRKLILTNQVFRHDGNRTNSIEFSQWPVRSIVSIHDDATWQFGPERLLDPSTYILSGDGMFVYTKYISFNSGNQNVRIEALYGYDSPSLPTIYPMHPIIGHAALLMTEWLYALRTDRRIGVDSKSKNSETIKFSEGIPETIAQMLLPLKRDFFMPDTRPLVLR